MERQPARRLAALKRAWLWIAIAGVALVWAVWVVFRIGERNAYRASLGQAPMDLGDPWVYVGAAALIALAFPFVWKARHPRAP